METDPEVASVTAMQDSFVFVWNYIRKVMFLDGHVDLEFNNEHGFREYVGDAKAASSCDIEHSAESHDVRAS